MEEGYQRGLGARPFRTLIQKKVEDTLSELYLKGDITKGEKIYISVVAGSMQADDPDLTHEGGSYTIQTDYSDNIQTDYSDEIQTDDPDTAMDSDMGESLDDGADITQEVDMDELPEGEAKIIHRDDADLPDDDGAGGVPALIRQTAGGKGGILVDVQQSSGGGKLLRFVRL